MKSSAISENDLHAYIDGQLPAARQREVADWLERDPAHLEALERVHAYRRQNAALHALYDEVLDEAIPARLTGAARANPAGAANYASWLRYAAMLALVLAGGAGGWLLRDAAQDGAMQWLPGTHARLAAVAPITLARQAAVAHNVYSPDLRRPVEVGADQEQALVTWLSRRIGANVRAPKLAPLGYDLIGGRLLPGQSGPVAQFMYQDAGGQRLTLYVSRDQVQSRGTGFRFAQEGKVNVFYWIDGQFGYALSGGIARNELSRIASSVYAQLETAPPAAD
ncbi:MULTISPECIES: anti-sigma factor [unclassified Herbaspirillum]|uniref:anti-sigma factor family protein n=1 Tax=unclassified Herbaspirillum TaxID=2624150 RepID=UPI00114DEB56|nr:MULTISPECIES: anti-sigma factor [unclassified Herbaspirillum]MBB5393459.1 anti-sigma factor RsiW [Herbaspirillum sp. SJZ102]TQK03793.1 anti-sigma factor RsiW [Herbaspirillum sp. SJZ130]TQK08525.1 anti-sigma factor RsiW [Herbaspirillum sp. SJZ106]